LDEIPLFVRAGAMVPMGPIARNASLVPEDAPLTLSVYPSGETSFDLYEDDKVTRGYATGEFSNQHFTVQAAKLGAGDVTVTIGERTGSYEGMATSRPYVIEAHTGSEPTNVMVGGSDLEQIPADSAADFAQSGQQGWYYADGVLHVNVGKVAAGECDSVVLEGTSDVSGL